VPPRKKAPAGPPALTDGDVGGLRARLAAGEKPRVVVRAASAAVPAGTRGNVVRMGNPSDGEFIVVRLGRDEVPFAPSELAIGPRSGRPAKVAPAPVAAPVPVAAPAPARAAKKAAAGRPVGAKAAKSSAPAASAGAATGKATKAATSAPSARAGRSSGTSRRTAKRKALPALVVTLRFDDGGWTVEASRGARRVSKASPVRPGAVKAFADLVDEPAVREALTETIESCRSVVEERAASLRAELHAAEAALKDYDARRR
jgi:hypothetical protein